MGDAGGPHGDLFVAPEVAHDARYERHDLSTLPPACFYDTRLPGGKLEIETLTSRNDSNPRRRTTWSQNCATRKRNPSPTRSRARNFIVQLQVKIPKTLKNNAAY